tara:strand:- start:121 stop:561 length:441 start_codon:yes stop_codon:yes gene_type:complete
MLDLPYHILTNSTPITNVVGDRISPMIRPQSETLPAIVFSLSDTKFEQITTMGATTTGTTRSAVDVYSVAVASMATDLGSAFALHEKVRDAFEAFTTKNVDLDPNAYLIHGIHLDDVISGVFEEGDVYTFEGVFIFKITRSDYVAP